MTTRGAQAALRQTADILRRIHNQPALADKFDAAALTKPHRIKLTKPELETLDRMTLPIDVQVIIRRLVER